MCSTAVSRIWEDWGFDLFILDHIRDVARADASEDYLEALEYIRDSFPTNGDAPAMLILCHMNKPQRLDKWRPKTGRALAHEYMGGSMLINKARTAFAMQPASQDMNDPRCVFEVCKCNNEVPNPPSAWERNFGEFKPLVDFDFDLYYNPPDDAKGGEITEKVMAELFQEGKRRMLRKIAVAELKEKGYSQANAYRATETEEGKARFPQLTEDSRGCWHGGRRNERDSTTPMAPLLPLQLAVAGPG